MERPRAVERLNRQPHQLRRLGGERRPDRDRPTGDHPVVVDPVSDRDQLVELCQGGDLRDRVLGTGGVYDPEVVAIILASVPGIEADDWQLEPSETLGIDPSSGEIVWSTMLPPETRAQLAEIADLLEGDDDTMMSQSVDELVLPTSAQVDVAMDVVIDAVRRDLGNAARVEFHIVVGETTYTLAQEWEIPPMSSQVDAAMDVLADAVRQDFSDDARVELHIVTGHGTAVGRFE